jgi:hypothetical protein
MAYREQETAHSNGAAFILYLDSISWDDSAFVQLRNVELIKLIDKFFVREFLRKTNMVF